MAGRSKRESKVLLRGLTDTARDWFERAGDPDWNAALAAQLQAFPRALTRTLPWLLRARGERDESLLKVALRNARRAPGELALEMDDERLTWADLDALTSRIAHVLRSVGVRAGDVVALVGMNSPRYVAYLLGISRIGATAALVNYHLDGGPLSHAVRASGARVALVAARFVDALRGRDDLRAQLQHILPYGTGELDERLSSAPATPFRRQRTRASDDFVYIYTSGTTGLPKPCRVTHARALLAGAGFGQLLFDFAPGDKLYCVLPLYHSSALLIGAGSCIMTRTPMALRESLSVSSFWNDTIRYHATAILYIGELARYLVNTPPCEAERINPVRVAVGNGMRADVWETFQRRFGIAQVREFYTATEAPGVIFNLSGKVGSVGQVPFRRLGALKLARYDVEQDRLARDDRGLCVECAPNQTGELLIRLPEKPRSALGEFRGYTDASATANKVLEDVFTPGDRYFRSGDLMRHDANDQFYFVDRIGDTYRWKGENVSTAEVAEVIGRAQGIAEATVSGVRVPGNEGQAGLAAVVCNGEFHADAFWKTAQGLPSYAQPRFVRVLSSLDTTGTYKIQKARLRAEGVDPAALTDAIFVRRADGYVRLTPELWREITEGKLRL